MKIVEIKKCDDELILQLYQVWYSSVKATHSFLKETDFNLISKMIPDILKNVKHLIIMENDLHLPVAFMGIENQSLEMLFIDEKYRGMGIGKQLLTYAVKYYRVDSLTVNEQNYQARGFYEHLGFKVVKRSEYDEQGNHYPILYMKK